MGDFKLSSIEDALKDFKDGQFVIVVDDEDRENEGDLIIAAEKITPEKVNFMLKNARGVLCAPITLSRCEELDLPHQVSDNTSMLGTPFTVTIDKLEGCTTGVSTHDRAATTKKPQGEGFSFDNSTSFIINEDKRMSYYESFRGNYRKGGFDITGFLYGAYTHQPDNKRIQQYTYTSNTWLQNTKITQEYINLNPYARLNASYMFDDENSIGASFGYDRYARKEGRGLQQAMSYCNDQLVETSRGDYFSPGHTSKYLANAYYVGKIGALKIDFNTDYYWYGDKDRMTIKESVTGEDILTVCVNNPYLRCKV